MRKYLESFSVHLIRRLINLSEAALNRFLGSPPVNTNGTELDHQLHALSVFARSIPLIELLKQGVGPTRLLSKLAIEVFDINPPQIPMVEEYRIDGPEGSLPLRVYSPVLERELPGCVFFHGGGFVLGDLDTHDNFCRLLAKRSKTRVVSVGYRLAPEYPFPAAVEDGLAAYRWVSRHTDDLNIEPDSLAVAGDSAGGTLATVVCQRRLVEGEVPPDFQLLIYPKTDHGVDYPSRCGSSENLFLSQRAVDWFSEQYRGDSTVDPREDHRLSPLQFNQLNKMPATMLATAGFDPLRDEGRAYADKLEENDVVVHRYPFERLIHGFISLGGIVDRARDASEKLASEFRSHIRGI